MDLGLVFWALVFTLLVPLIAWTALFSIFGWKLFIVLIVAFVALFYFRDKLFQSQPVQAALQMLIPFALTFRFYDALRAGKEKSKEEANSFQVLLASTKGFFQGDREEDEEETKKVARSTKEEAPHAKKAKSESFWGDDEDEAKEEASATPQAPQTPQPPPKPSKPSDEQLDDMLSQLKQKMAEKEKVQEKIPERD